MSTMELKSVLDGSSYAEYMALRDMKSYESYKSGKTEEIENLVDMKILSLLEGLGYPMEHLGTYLYKDLVRLVYDKIKNLSKRSDVLVARQILSELSDHFSSIYHYIAREDKEIGIKSFHMCLEDAIKSIDKNKIDSALATRIYGSYFEAINYGQKAMLFAAYVAGKYTGTYEEPKIRALDIHY